MGLPLAPPEGECRVCGKPVHREPESGIWLHWGYLTEAPDHFARPIVAAADA